MRDQRIAYFFVGPHCPAAASAGVFRNLCGSEAQLSFMQLFALG